MALKKRQVLEEAFVRDLRRRMFSRTWSWAGNFRNTDKTIGVPSEHVATRLHQLLGEGALSLKPEIRPSLYGRTTLPSAKGIAPATRF